MRSFAHGVTESGSFNLLDGAVRMRNDSLAQSVNVTWGLSWAVWCSTSEYQGYSGCGNGGQKGAIDESGTYFEPNLLTQGYFSRDFSSFDDLCAPSIG